MHVCQPIGDRASFRNGSGRGENGCFTAWRRRRFPGPCSFVGNSFVCCDMRCCMRLDPQGKPSLIRKPVLWLASSTGKLFFPVIVEARPSGGSVPSAGRDLAENAVPRAWRRASPFICLRPKPPLSGAPIPLIRLNAARCPALRFPGFHGLHAGRGGRHEPYS